MSKVRRRFCCDADLAAIGYDGRDAAKDLAALRANGPRPTTQELIDVVVARGVEGAGGDLRARVSPLLISHPRAG